MVKYVEIAGIAIDYISNDGKLSSLAIELGRRVGISRHRGRYHISKYLRDLPNGDSSTFPNSKKEIFEEDSLDFIKPNRILFYDTWSLGQYMPYVIILPSFALLKIKKWEYTRSYTKPVKYFDNIDDNRLIIGNITMNLEF